MPYIVYVIDMVILSMDYRITNFDGRYKTYEHDELPTIIISSSGSYQMHQLEAVVIRKLHITKDQFLDLYSQFSKKMDNSSIKINKKKPAKRK